MWEMKAGLRNIRKFRPRHLNETVKLLEQKEQGMREIKH